MSTRLKLILSLLLLGGVAAVAIAVSLQPPARRPFRSAQFITLGELGRELANDPKTYDAVLEKLGGGRTGYGLVSGAERLALKKLFAAADYDALDARPQTTIQELKAGLAILAGQRQAAAPPPALPPLREALGIPTGAPTPSGEPFLKDVGLGLLYGDRLDLQKAKRFKDSERLAAVLNRLSLPGEHALQVGDATVANVPQLVAALEKQGNTVTVRDERFLANFGDLEWKGHPVATPLWVRAGAFVLPVPHEQLTLAVRGPIQADVTFYNSLDLAGDGDGGTLFRADVTRDQPWVGGRVFHEYKGEQAREVVRLMAELRRAADEKVRGRHLPLDGYFALGVCTLAPALAEQAVLHRTTAWPLTQDVSLFDGDSELDRMVRALPVDLADAAPEKDRVLASVPWERVAEIPFPALRAALEKL